MRTFAARLRSNFQALFRPGAQIYEQVSEGRQFDALYLSMLVFGCLIALLGLLLNSPAVIIGAMLISPLMGPILSCGLALTMADAELAKRAGRNLALSIVETILIAAIATWASPLKDVTPEILARTNPNLMDLLVAFFSGAAGTLALCSQRPGFTIVPGVAIATAVMPPLATVGYGISTRQWSIASGAFMLFVTNLASIVVSADIVFLLVGVRHGVPLRPLEENWWVRYRMAISWTILVVLSIPLIRTLISAADQRRTHNVIRSTLAQQLNHPGTSRLDEVTVQLGRDSVSAEATVQIARLILPGEQKRIEQQLSQRLGRKVVLHLDQIQLAQAEKPAAAVTVSRDYVGGGRIRPPTEEVKLSPAEMMQKMLRNARDELAPLLQVAGLEKFDISSVGEDDDGRLDIEVRGTYRDKATDLQVWNVICAAAAQKFKAPVRLTATMSLPEAQTHWIQYHGKNVRPSVSELRSAQRMLAKWKKQGLDHGFIVPKETDAKLFPQRLEYLQLRLGQGLGLPHQLTSGADTTSNTVGMAPVQLIDVSTSTAESATSVSK